MNDSPSQCDLMQRGKRRAKKGGAAAGTRTAIRGHVMKPKQENVIVVTIDRVKDPNILQAKRQIEHLLALLKPMKKDSAFAQFPLPTCSMTSVGWVSPGREVAATEAGRSPSAQREPAEGQVMVVNKRPRVKVRGRQGSRLIGVAIDGRLRLLPSAHSDRRFFDPRTRCYRRDDTDMERYSCN